MRAPCWWGLRGWGRSGSKEGTCSKPGRDGGFLEGHFPLNFTSPRDLSGFSSTFSRCFSPIAQYQVAVRSSPRISHLHYFPLFRPRLIQALQHVHAIFLCVSLHFFFKGLLFPPSLLFFICVICDADDRQPVGQHGAPAPLPRLGLFTFGRANYDSEDRGRCSVVVGGLRGSSGPGRTAGSLTSRPSPRPPDGTTAAHVMCSEPPVHG